MAARGMNARCPLWMPVGLTMALAGCMAVTDRDRLEVESRGPELNAAPTADGKALETARQRLATLTLQGKVGQMIQADIGNLLAAEANHQQPFQKIAPGSVLITGDGMVGDLSPARWRQTLLDLQKQAARAPGAVPLLIGVDAIHGLGIVRGATIFPHQIALGATGDPELMTAIGTVVAREARALGFQWTFAPMVAVAEDLRWGRTYESFGSSPAQVRRLAPPLIRGFHGQGGAPYLAATAKHFMGDGGTLWGTGVDQGDGRGRGIDRGDTPGPLARIYEVHGAGYEAAIAAGVDTVMASYSSIGRQPMHSRKDLIAGSLKADRAKGGFGFQGMVVSDLNAVDEMPAPGIVDPIAKYRQQVLTAVAAGVDMLMVTGRLELGKGRPDRKYRYERVQEILLAAVQQGRLSPDRIDDAVLRILTVKARVGLFRGAVTPADGDGIALVGSELHREVARTAVRKSLVLLRNGNGVLPITKARYDRVCLLGSRADDFGAQVGPWTLSWQGRLGAAAKVPGAWTLREGLATALAKMKVALTYVAKVDGATALAACRSGSRTLTLVVVGEDPYAEFRGDASLPALGAADRALLERAALGSGPVAAVIYSGRPLVLPPAQERLSGLVAAWWPGSQGEAVAEVLTGAYGFSGRLPQRWPASAADLRAGVGSSGLFPVGHGLITAVAKPQ